MSGERQPPRRLVADIGGTNTRLAIYDARRNEMRALHSYANGEFDGPAAVIDTWLASLGETPPATACLVVAAPPGGDTVQMLNRDWRFSRRELQRRFGWRQTAWLNDFAGIAYALPFLGRRDLTSLRAPEPGQERPGQENAGREGHFAVLGPGTGLGGATLLRRGGESLVLPAEPGHMGLSPGTREELALFRELLGEHNDIYAELLISGPGLERLYRASARVHGQRAEDLDAAVITRRAVAAADPLCENALKHFCALLGSVAGDFLLANGSLDGLYLAGGIVPRILPQLAASDFLTRLQTKGGMREHLHAVPVRVITASQPGLLGAAHAPLPPAEQEPAAGR